MSNDEREIRRKLRVLEHADQSGNIRLTCRYFGIPRSLFYVWRGKYRAQGRAGLARHKAVGAVYPTAIAPDVVEKVLHLRRTYHLGPIRIAWYMERYHGIRISDASVYRICRRHGMNRLPGRVGRCLAHFPVRWSAIRSRQTSRAPRHRLPRNTPGRTPLRAHGGSPVSL